MNDLNSVNIVGRLTRDAELKYTNNGSAVASMSIATNRIVKRGEQWENEAYFFDITLFGKSAENLKNYLTKGKQIAVSGILKQDRWEKDGQKFSKVQILADSIQLLGGKSDGNNNSIPSRIAKTESVPQSVQNVSEAFEGFTEDIPF